MFYKKLVINGIEYNLAANLSGDGAPTEENEAAVGMYYMDETTGDCYKRTAEGWFPLETGSGKSGSFWWIATIPHQGEFSTTVYKSQIVPFDGREIAVGDLLLYTDCVVQRITSVGTSAVGTEDTGIVFDDGSGGSVGANGLSIWAATIEHSAIDEMYLEKAQILGADEREIKINDLVIFIGGKVGRVVEVLDDAVNTVYTGNNLGSVIVEETDEEILIPEVVQTTGDSEEDVMSQKAVTELFKNVGLSEKDKTDIARIVLEMLGEHIGGYVDENNQIIVTDELPDGKYIFEYEMEDGSNIGIGYGVEEVAPTVKNGVVAENGDLYYYTEDELTFAGVVSYNGNLYYFAEDGKAVKDGRFDVTKTNDVVEVGRYRFDFNGYLVLNEIPLSTNADGSIIFGPNGEYGYKTNTRLSSSSGNESTQTGVEATGFIPVTYNDTICLKNLTISTGGTNIFCFYDKDFNWLVGMYSSALTAQEEVDGGYRCKITAIDNNKLHGQNSPHTGLPIKDEVAYMRVSADEIDGNSVITVYQPVVEEVEE